MENKNANETANKKAILAIKIALACVFVSAMLGIFSLWTLLNQVTISVGIDKKIIELESRLQKVEDSTKGTANVK